MTYILPKAGTGEPLRHMLLDVVEADAVEFLAHRSRCRKRLSTSTYFLVLCLSRACLGKMIVFNVKRLLNGWFTHQ